MIDTSALVEGAVLGAGLFTSVGPKDAFVVRISVHGTRPLLVACICAGSDALLIALGALGLAAGLSHRPHLLSAALLGGIVYLAWHGLLALHRATRAQATDAGPLADKQSLYRTLMSTAAVSLLNPYAWIDTVLVFGSIIASRPASARLSMGLGATTASLAWFLLLTYGARQCRALFAKRIAWRVLDVGAGMMMLTVAVHLAMGQR